MANKKVLSLALLGLAAPWPALALDNGQNNQPVPVLDEVVVTAARTPEPVKDVTAAITVIGPEEIALSPARDLGDLLAEKGIGFINKYPGVLTAAGIRGFKSDTMGNDLKGHVLVLLNGRRAGTGNVAKIMTSNVERVEIIRGPGAVQYGSAAMGGVINVITRQGKGSPAVEPHVGAGRYGYDEKGILISGEASGFDLSASIDRSCMDDYSSGSGEQFHNTGYGHIDGYSLNSGYTFLDKHRIGLIYNRFDGAEIGSPGYISANDLDNFTDKSSRSFDLIYDGKSGDRYSWHLGYFAGRDKNTWFDPTGNNASGWDDGLPDRNRTGQDGAQAQFTVDNGIFRLTGGLDWLKYDVENSWNPAQTEYRNYAGFALARAKFMEESLIADAGLRYDAFGVEVVEPHGGDEEDRQFTSSLGLAYLFIDGLKIRTHYGEAFIMPAADELAADFYSEWGVHYAGNQELDPESSRTYETGIEYCIKELKAGLNYFYTRYKDKIESVASGADQTWENRGKAEISGIEGEFSWDLGARFGWRYEVRPHVNFVYLDHYKDLDNHEDLKYINDWNVSYGVSAGDYEGFSASLNLAYTGRQKIDDWETYAFPPPVIRYGGFTVADLSVSKKVLDLEQYGSFTLTCDITNLFDREYAYVKGYPMPGQMFFLELTYRY